MDRDEIPPKNSTIDNILQKYFASASTSAEMRKLIEKKMGDIDDDVELKINNAYTISDYFQTLWNHEELRMPVKENAIKKIDGIIKVKKNEILRGDITIPEESGCAEELIDTKHRNSRFEEFNASEKMREIQDRKWVLEHRLHSIDADLDIMKALNRPYYSSRN